MRGKKFLVELYMDGYETQKEHDDACIEFMDDLRFFTAIGVSSRVSIVEEEIDDVPCQC